MNGLAPTRSALSARWRYSDSAAAASKIRSWARAVNRAREQLRGPTRSQDVFERAERAGVARVDIAPNGKGCELVWTNTTVTPASYGAKLSTKTGLVYLFARQPDPVSGVDVWYWTAVDFRTGETVWQQLVGTGRWFDGYWPLPFLGPTGIGYMATYGGIVAIRDTR